MGAPMLSLCRTAAVSARTRCQIRVSTPAEAFLSRLAYLRSTGAISDLTRHLACLEVRAVLSVLPGLGLTRAGAPEAGLGQAFVLRRDDIAARPERAVAARDIPAGVMRQL